MHLIHNNAGVAAGGLAWAISETDWRWVLGVNLWGVIHGIRSFVPLFLDQGEGHVVNTASIAGILSPLLFGPYCATKHAVVTISEVLYRDLRIVGSNVGVSVLCPGYVRTAIGESQRNRPAWAPASMDIDPAGEQMRASIAQSLAAGMDPTVVADKVLDAVRADRFYILTHPESRAAVELRMQDILTGRAPTEIQPTLG